MWCGLIIKLITKNCINDSKLYKQVKKITENYILCISKTYAGFVSFSSKFCRFFYFVLYFIIILGSNATFHTVSTCFSVWLYQSILLHILENAICKRIETNPKSYLKL